MNQPSLAEVLEWKYGLVANTEQDKTDIPQGAKDALQAAQDALSAAEESEDEDKDDVVKEARLQLRLAQERAKAAMEQMPNPKMVISEWRHPTISEPDTAQIAQDTGEYKAWKATQPVEKTDKEKIADLEARVAALEQGA